MFLSITGEEDGSGKPRSRPHPRNRHHAQKEVPGTVIRLPTTEASHMQETRPPRSGGCQPDRDQQTSGRVEQRLTWEGPSKRPKFQSQEIALARNGFCEIAGPRSSRALRTLDFLRICRWLQTGGECSSAGSGWGLLCDGSGEENQGQAQVRGHSSCGRGVPSGR
jgi:hypothetical protein